MLATKDTETRDKEKEITVINNSQQPMLLLAAIVVKVSRFSPNFRRKIYVYKHDVDDDDEKEEWNRILSKFQAINFSGVM